jgi:hypothetical protein
MPTLKTIAFLRYTQFPKDYGFWGNQTFIIIHLIPPQSLEAPR